MYVCHSVYCSPCDAPVMKFCSDDVFAVIGFQKRAIATSIQMKIHTWQRQFPCLWPEPRLGLGGFGLYRVWTKAIIKNHEGRLIDSLISTNWHLEDSIRPGRGSGPELGLGISRDFLLDVPRNRYRARMYSCIFRFYLIDEFRWAARGRRSTKVVFTVLPQTDRNTPKFKLTAIIDQRDQKKKKKKRKRTPVKFNQRVWNIVWRELSASTGWADFQWLVCVCVAADQHCNIFSTHLRTLNNYLLVLMRLSRLRCNEELAYGFARRESVGTCDVFSLCRPGWHLRGGVTPSSKISASQR